MKLYSLCNTQSTLHLALPLSTKISVMELLSTASVPCSSFFFLSVCTLPHVLWGACIGLLLHPFCAGKKRKYLYIPFNVYTSVSGPAFQLSYRALSGWWLGCELQWGCKPITRKQAFLLAKNDRPFKALQFELVAAVFWEGGVFQSHPYVILPNLSTCKYACLVPSVNSYFQ